MKKIVSKLLAVSVVAFGLISSVSVYAEDEITEVQTPMRKFGRGISNVAFGVLEIPLQISDVNREDGGLAAVTYGTVKGVCRFVGRELTGVVELVTFFAPLPGCNPEREVGGWGYGPIMDAEFIIDKDHNFLHIVHQDEPGVFNN